MNEQNTNSDNNKSQNTSQPFDYKAHYRQQNHPHENTYYRKSENNHSQSYYQETNNSRYYQNNSNQPPTPPENPPYTQSYPSSDNTKAFCIISYISIFWIIGLLADRNNPKVRFHVNQGIILTIFEVVLNILVAILKSFINIVLMGPFTKMLIISQFGMVLNGMLSFIVWCFYIVFTVIGIIHAAQDRQEPLPIIGTVFQILK